MSLSPSALPPAEPSASEQSIEQRYLDLFQKSPEAAVKLLQKLHVTKGTGCVLLSNVLKNVLVQESEASGYTALIQAGLLNAVVQIACEFFTYAKRCTNRSKLVCTWQ